jgi:hypothetical protein
MNNENLVTKIWNELVGMNWEDFYSSKEEGIEDLEYMLKNPDGCARILSQYFECNCIEDYPDTVSELLRRVNGRYIYFDKDDLELMLKNSAIRYAMADYVIDNFSELDYITI